VADAVGETLREVHLNEAASRCHRLPGLAPQSVAVGSTSSLAVGRRTLPCAAGGLGWDGAPVLSAAFSFLVPRV
jgi:hypothetical protein